MKLHKFSQLSNSLALAFLSMSALSFSHSVHALGLGEVQVQSAIGEPLVANIELLADANELSTLRMGLAASAEYQMQGVEFNSAINGARVVIKKNDAGKTIAQIIGRTPVSEPYVQVIIDGDSSSGKVRRAYSLFIDPSRRIMGKLPGEGSYTEISRPVILPALSNIDSPLMPALPALKVQPGTPVRAETNAGLTNIMERGDAPDRIDNVKGYGRKQSISHALFTIVPKGWKGYSGDAGVKFAQSVDWDGNRSWLTVLDGVLASAHLTALIDWKKKEITFSSVNTDEPVRGEGSVSGSSAPSAALTVQGSAPSAAVDGSSALALQAPQRGALDIKAKSTAFDTSLNQEIETQRKYAGNLEFQVRALTAKLQSANEGIGKAQTERGTLAAELAELKSNQSRANDELAVARKQMEVVNAALLEAKSRETAQAQRMAESPAQLPTLAVMPVLSQNVSAPEPMALPKLPALPGGASTGKEKSGAGTEPKERTSKVRILAMEVSGLQQRLESSQRRVAEAEQKADDLNATIAVRGQHNEKLLARLDKLQNERSTGQASVDATQSAWSKAQVDLAQEKTRAGRLESDLVIANEKLTASTSVLAQMNQKSTNQMGRSLELQNQVSALEKQLAAESSARIQAQEQAKKLNESLVAVQERLSNSNAIFSKKTEPVAIASLRQISLVGPALQNESTVMSSGMNVAFPTAIKQVVPQGWMVMTDPAVGNVSVGWNGDSRKWSLVLNEMLQSQGLKATIDSVAREVIIRR